MAGVFNIIPKGGSTITCAFGDNESIPYNIVAADFNEVEREEVLYSEGKLGGSVANINHGIVEATLLFAVGGTSEDDVAANTRILNGALRNADGGLIEYRPREYSDTVTNTFYRYLKTGVSRRISKKTLIPTETHVTGELHEFIVTTFAWATSDPNNFVTLQSETAIDNHDDAGHSNYIDIPGSGIKGDIFFPIIKYRASAGALWSNFLIVHKRPMRVGAHTNLDWWEGEDLVISGSSVVPLATASNGEYRSVSSYPSTSDGEAFTGWDSTYMGNISPIVCARRAPASSALISIVFSIHNAGATVQSAAFDTNVWPTFDSWTALYEFSELTIPPYEIQQHITDTSTPTIATYISQLEWKITVDLLEGAGAFYLDWVLLARSDDWISVFDSGLAYLETKAIKGDGTTYLEVDAISSTSYLKANSDDSMILPWASSGSAVSNLFFRSDEDTRLRFIAPGARTSNPYSGLFGGLVTITGVHATVYPFNT